MVYGSFIHSRQGPPIHGNSQSRSAVGHESLEPLLYLRVGWDKCGIACVGQWYIGAQKQHKHEDPTTMVSGILLVLGLRTRMQDPYVDFVLYTAIIDHTILPYTIIIVCRTILGSLCLCGLWDAQNRVSNLSQFSFLRARCTYTLANLRGHGKGPWYDCYPLPKNRRNFLIQGKRGASETLAQSGATRNLLIIKVPG